MGQAETDIRVERKITHLMERMSNVFRALQWDLAKKKKLTPLQIQILQYLRYRPKHDSVPSVIASELGITKATLSESVRALKRKQLLRGELNTNDRRFTNLILTPAGVRIVNELNSIERVFENYISRLKMADKRYAMRFLVNIITLLYMDGYIKTARLCCTCQHFHKNSSGNQSFICALTGKKMQDWEIKLDCNSHKPIRLKKGGMRVCC